MWYYSKNGMQLGPISTEQLSGKARGGEVLSSDLIWKEGMSDWKPLAQVPEFQSTGGFSNPPPVGMGSVPMQQPPMYPAGYAPGSVPNYLWQSIVVTVLCCLPFGVVSIVYAAKVDSLLIRGDIVGATAASQSAKNWAIAGVASWAVGIGIYLIFMVVVAAGAAASSP
jgi:hypothetical protein